MTVKIIYYCKVKDVSSYETLAEEIRNTYKDGVYLIKVWDNESVVGVFQVN